MAEEQVAVRVAYDNDGDRWDEQTDEAGVRTGWFKHRPDPVDLDGDELQLWQLVRMYGVARVVPASEDAGRALLRWLHAEAVWHREQLDAEALKWTEVAGGHAEEIEALRAESANRLEVGDRLGWRLVEAQEEVRALKAAIADIDAHATPVGLLHNDDPEGSPHHYLLTVGALHRALGKAYTAEPCESERARLRVEVDRLRREVQFEAASEQFMHQTDLSLRPCACLTTAGAAQVAADPRWSAPQCSVHPDRGAE